MINKNLVETNPDIANEWDYQKNEGLTPFDVSHGSTKKVWWLCEKGHSYFARIDHRCIMKSGCPYCHHRKVKTGETDLATLYPEIAQEWDYEKNRINPSEISAKSNRTIYWICKNCGESYKRQVSERTASRFSCPNCAKEKGTSFYEQALLFYIQKAKIALNRQKIDNMEIDIFIPEIQIGIEYNGAYYHQSRIEHDNKKASQIRSKGIRLITINEGNENIISGDEIKVKSKNYRIDDAALTWMIKTVLNILGINQIDVNIIHYFQ